MSQTVAILIILSVFAAGEILAFISKEKIPSMFAIMIIFLILFITGIIPDDICTISGFTYIAEFGMFMLLINMGSSVDIELLKREWKTVVCACIGMIFAMMACVIVAPLVGFKNALVSIPVINGGIVATNIMVEKANSLGMTTAASLAIFVFAVQKLVGSLPAARYGLRIAEDVVRDHREKKLQDPNYSFYTSGNQEDGEVKVRFCDKHKDIFTTFTCLAIGAVGIAVAELVGRLSNGWLGTPICCMIIGIIMRNMGLVPGNFLRDNAKANGFFSFLAFIVIIPAIAKIELNQIIELGIKGSILFAAVIIITFIIFKFTPLWKIVGSKELSIGIAMCQMIGFPGTDLIATEIATAIGKNQEERDAIYAKIGVSYVISGFASVTILSVFVANILVKIF